MSPLALPFVPSLHFSGKDNYASNEAPFIVSANVSKRSLSVSLSEHKAGEGGGSMDPCSPLIYKIHVYLMQNQ